jgi:hypothetical protein
LQGLGDGGEFLCGRDQAVTLRPFLHPIDSNRERRLRDHIARSRVG